MTQPFLGEIRMFAGNFAPKGNAFCDGAILAIQQNAALFSLLGTSFGGNGTSNFALPNLQSSIPIGTGTGPGLSPRVIGESGGSPTVTLLPSEMPIHPHVMNAGGGRGAITASIPVAGAAFTASKGGSAYTPYTAGNNAVLLAPNTLLPQGSSQPHNNIMPSLSVTFIIALSGVFPARN